MWADERRGVCTSEPAHWSDVVRLSPSSVEALRHAPRAGVHDVLGAVEEDLAAQLMRQSVRWRLDHVRAVRYCLDDIERNLDVDPRAVSSARPPVPAAEQGACQA